MDILPIHYSVDVKDSSYSTIYTQL